MEHPDSATLAEKGRADRRFWDLAGQYGHALGRQHQRRDFLRLLAAGFFDD
jgi:hypothetical protein